MEKWLEFRVEEDCPHEQDVYNGCPLCREEAKDAEIAELLDWSHKALKHLPQAYWDSLKEITEKHKVK